MLPNDNKKGGSNILLPWKGAKSKEARIRHCRFLPFSVILWCFEVQKRSED